jgi:CheY-like chemotaxis protein
MRVLIADDEKGFATAFAALVQSCHHEVVDVVSSGLEAIRSYHKTRPDVVLLDYNMSKLNGLTACRNILSSDPAGRIIFLTGSAEAADLAPRVSGAVGCLQKPVKIQELQQLLETLRHCSCASSEAA